MFVKWSNRARAYTERLRRTNEPHRTMIAQLVESKRVDGRSRQRVIAHLGTCVEPVENPRHRIWFYRRCDEVLARLDLSADDRDQIAAQLEARLKRPNEAEQAELKSARAALFGRPDGFTALVMAWTAANQTERERFIDELRTAGSV